MLINTVDNVIESSMSIADSLNLDSISEPSAHPAVQAKKDLPKKNKVHDWYQEAMDA